MIQNMKQYCARCIPCYLLLNILIYTVAEPTYMYVLPTPPSALVQCCSDSLLYVHHFDLFWTCCRLVANVAVTLSCCTFIVCFTLSTAIIVASVSSCTTNSQRIELMEFELMLGPASSSGDVVVPRTRRRIGDTAFSVAAPREWNTLPTQLKLLRSTGTGKRTDDCFVMRPRSPSRAHTHTHTHPFIGPLSGTTQVSRCQTGKTNLGFTGARVAVASAGPYASLHLAPDR